ncbi:hypothetical protein TRVL_08133 [Trypanosoma vivax]|nr:hypothetical protein TRVL_08133 [Trypanosoma vivax]
MDLEQEVSERERERDVPHYDTVFCVLRDPLLCGSTVLSGPGKNENKRMDEGMFYQSYQSARYKCSVHPHGSLIIILDGTPLAHNALLRYDCRLECPIISPCLGNAVPSIVKHISPKHRPDAASTASQHNLKQAM